jgi:hypothetical protein
VRLKAKTYPRGSKISTAARQARPPAAVGTVSKLARIGFILTFKPCSQIGIVPGKQRGRISLSSQKYISILLPCLTLSSLVPKCSFIFRLTRQSKALYKPQSHISILQQTQKLHKDIATAIDLRECMRVHCFSTKHFLSSFQGLLLPLPPSLERGDLIQRLNNRLSMLEYYDLASTTLLEQQENLLNLASERNSLLLIIILADRLAYRHSISRPQPKHKFPSDRHRQSTDSQYWDLFSYLFHSWL